MNSLKFSCYSIAISLFLLGSTQELFAQDEVITYVKKNGGFTADKDSAAYTRIISNAVDSTGFHVLTEYYANGNLKRQGHVQSTSPRRMLAEGWVETYYENGNLNTRIRYANTRRIDTAYFYFSNGVLNEKRFYLNSASSTINQKDAVNMQQIYYADSTGRVMVEDGKGCAEIALNKVDKEKGAFVNGYRHGQWFGTFLKGKYQFEEWYDKGKLTWGVSRDSTGKEYSYTKVRIQPQYPGGISNFMQIVGQSFTYSKEAIDNKVEGRLRLKFVIDATGNPTEFELIQDVGYGTYESAIEAVHAAGPWTPGNSRGVPVKVKYTLPLLLHFNAASNSEP